MLVIFSLVWEKTFLGDNRPKGPSCIRKFSERPGQWLQFLPGRWALAGFSRSVQMLPKPVVWAGAVSWFSPADLVLFSSSSSSSSTSWKHELFSGKLPWSDWHVEYFCQLNFQCIHGAGLLLMRMPHLVSLLFPLFNSALSFTALQRVLQQKGNSWTMQHEAKSFLYLS